MRRKKNRKKRTFLTVFSSKLFLFVLILLLAWMGKMTIEKFISWNHSSGTLAVEEEKIQEEEKKKEEFEKTLEYFESEDYLERTAKEKLNLAKPGEKVIYVLPEKESEEGEESFENEGFWKKLKAIFTK